MDYHAVYTRYVVVDCTTTRCLSSGKESCGYE